MVCECVHRIFLSTSIVFKQVIFVSLVNMQHMHFMVSAKLLGYELCVCMREADAFSACFALL